MYIEIDLARVPPEVSLRKPSAFDAFKVVVTDPGHAYVAPEVVRELAGELGDDPRWVEQFTAMVAAAAAHGWVRDDGAILAHVEKGE